MLNLILLFFVVGCVSFIFMIYAAIKNEPSEAPKQEFIEVNDLPNWQPMTPIQKRSNRVLNQMYKGRAGNENI